MKKIEEFECINCHSTKAHIEKKYLICDGCKTKYKLITVKEKEKLTKQDWLLLILLSLIIVLIIYVGILSF